MENCETFFFIYPFQSNVVTHFLHKKYNITLYTLQCRNFTQQTEVEEQEEFFLYENCIYLRKSLWYRKLQQKFPFLSRKYFMKNQNVYNHAAVTLSLSVRHIYM